MLQMQTDRAVDITTEEKVEDENTNTFIMGRPDPTDAIAHIFELLTAEKNNKIYPCDNRIPRGSNVDGSGPCRKLCHMARPEHKSSE